MTHAAQRLVHFDRVDAPAELHHAVPVTALFIKGAYSGYAPFLDRAGVQLKRQVPPAQLVEPGSQLLVAEIFFAQFMVGKEQLIDQAARLGPLGRMFKQIPNALSFLQRWAAPSPPRARHRGPRERDRKPPAPPPRAPPDLSSGAFQVDRASQEV